MIRKVDYFAVQVPNRPGEAVKLLRALSRAKVNLLAFTGFPSGRGSQIDFVPKDSKAFLRVAKGAGWTIGEKKTGFLVQGKDHPGALSAVLGKLARANINVTAVDGVAAGGKRYAAILWVKEADVPAAGKVLKARR